MKKLFALLFVALMAMGIFTACESMGRATGEVAEETEEGAKEFKEGYDEGKDN